MAKQRTLSVADLRKAGACREALDTVKSRHGNKRVLVTVETVTPFVKYVHWAVYNLLTPAARKQYYDAVAPAYKQYNDAVAPAR